MSQLPRPPIRPIPGLASQAQLATLEWARTKDPMGHVAHRWIAAVCLGVQPVATSAAGIGQLILIVYAVLRLHATWRCYATLLRSRLWWIFLAWFLYAGLTLAWTSDIDQGMDSIRKGRFIFFALALWPILDKPRLLLFGIGMGILVQLVAQVLQFGGWVDWGYDPFPRRMNGGFSKHPGNTAIWGLASCCLMFGLALIPRTVRWHWWLLALFSMLCVFLSGSRSVYMGLGLALVMLMGLAVRQSRSQRQHMKSVVIGCVLLISGFVGFFTLIPAGEDHGVVPMQRLVAGWKNVWSARDDGASTSSESLRIFWWRVGYEEWKNAPIFGHGNGSLEGEFQKSPLFQKELKEASENENSVLITDNPHSSIAFVAVEQGLVGLVILATLFFILFTSSLARGGSKPELLGLSGGVLGMTIYGLFNTIELSGFTISLMSTLVIFAIPRPNFDEAEPSTSAS